MLLKKTLFLLFFLCYLNVISQVELQKFYNSTNGLNSEQVTQITQDYIGYLWIGTNLGLFKFDGDDFIKINNEKITFLTAKDKKVYFGTEKGLTITERNSKNFYESKGIKGILFHDKSTFIATEQGISELKENYIQPLQISTTVDFSTISDLIYHEDSFYVASVKGLFRIDDLKNPKEIKRISNQNFVDLQVFDKKIVAASDSKFGIIKDNEVFDINSVDNITCIKKYKNQLWVKSKTNGVEVYALPSFTFIKKINKYNSITTNYVYTGYQGINNNYWLGTHKGVYLFSSRVKDKNKPKVHFEQLEVNYEDRSDLLANKTNINLTSNENSVVITFKSIDLDNPNSMEYRYSLNGIISKWTKNNIIQLANLNFGDYDLKIQSRVNGITSDFNNLSFSIATPFYYHIYFILTSFIVSLLIIYLLTQQYINRIKKKNDLKVMQLQTENAVLSLKQRALQLQMNPHFVFNALNNIKALGNSGKVDELNQSISQFSSLLRSLLHNSTKEEISLKDELDSMENYLSLEKLISNKLFDYHIEVNIAQNDLDEILIPTMLLQPFVENSIKHGFSVNKKGLIKVLIQLKNNFLKISITDNGVGLTKSNQSKSSSNNSLALKITRERLDRITKYNNFEIKEVVSDNIVIGTKVSFKIPLVLDY